MKILFIIVTWFVLGGCSDSDKKIQSTPVVKKDSLDQLKKGILVGDTLAYLELRNFYVMQNKANDFLLWAILMANKYKYQTALHDVYFCINSLNSYYGKYSVETNENENILDSITISIANDFLTRYNNNSR